MHHSPKVAELLQRIVGVDPANRVVWIALNLIAVKWQWDPYPFILLNLAFSTQAAYAAPLILLAQNRQENRDRVALEEDRRRAEQTKADTEYLARELAALRLAVGEVATRDYLRRELEELRDLINDMRPSEPGAAKDKTGKTDGAEKRSKRTTFILASSANLPTVFDSSLMKGCSSSTLAA